MASITKTRLTAQEYFEQYPETTQPMELINGELIMSPAPLDDHQYCITRLIRLISNLTIPQNLGELRTAPTDVYLDEFTILQPDIFFVAKDNPRCKLIEKRWHGAPDLCIEVVSPSSVRRDRVDKFTLYARHGVREYWIVDVEGRFIEAYVLQGDRFERQGAYTEEEEFASVVLPELKISVGEIFPAVG